VKIRPRILGLQFFLFTRSLELVSPTVEGSSFRHPKSYGSQDGCIFSRKKREFFFGLKRVPVQLGATVSCSKSVSWGNYPSLSSRSEICSRVQKFTTNFQKSIGKIQKFLVCGFLAAPSVSSSIAERLQLGGCHKATTLGNLKFTLKINLQKFTRNLQRNNLSEI
jgi:hypothetical protein